MLRTYSELKRIHTFEGRYNYLKLQGIVGRATFGFDRYLNQAFYTSRRWRDSRDKVIVRDNGCDLGVAGYDLCEKILVHHMNPITIEDIENDIDELYDPEFLISTSDNTHRAIHYSDSNHLIKLPVTRSPGDTTPWR